MNRLTAFDSLQPGDSVKIRIETCHNCNPSLTTCQRNERIVEVQFP